MRFSHYLKIFFVSLCCIASINTYTLAADDIPIQGYFTTSEENNIIQGYRFEDKQLIIYFNRFVNSMDTTETETQKLIKLQSLDQASRINSTMNSDEIEKIRKEYNIKSVKEILETLNGQVDENTSIEELITKIQAEILVYIMV